MLLAIDTSTNYASLALADDGALLAELNWRIGRHHNTQTLDRARWLLAGQGIAVAQLDSIAVALGPGSFNGLRVALATAKALAFALGVPLYGIPTLDVIAWGARLSSDPIWALLDAGRGEVYAACYHPGDAQGVWAPQPITGVEGDATAGAGYLITTPEALAARIVAPVVFTGEWRNATRDSLAEALGERARFTTPLASRRGAALAELGALRAQYGAVDDPRALEPLYVRRPTITTARATTMRPAPAAPATPGGEETAHAL